MPLVLPNTITSGSVADAVELQGNYVATRDFVNDLETKQISDDAEQSEAIAAAIETADANAAAGLLVHTSDSTAAHAASAVSSAVVGSIGSTNVQAAIAEIEDELNDAQNVSTALDNRLKTAESDIVSLEPSAWTSLSLLNGWGNYAGRQHAQYRLVGDEVQFRGTIRHTGNVSAVFETCLVVPSAERRIEAMDSFPGTGTGVAPGMYFVMNTNGHLDIYNLPFDEPNKAVGALSLTGIRYAVT
jgi:hypothetical protein